VGLISRKRARQEAGEPPSEDSDTADQVEVTIEGPEAERLQGLVDMGEIAAMLQKRAAGPPPSP
jgi:hypothetical protein